MLLSVHLGETWASYPKERPHNGETGAIRFSESSHLGETKSSDLNGLLHLGESEASGSTGRLHLRETGAICPTRTSYVQETGAGCQTRRPHIGETGASCPTQRQHVGETGAGCPIRRPDIRETTASCPIRIQSVGETGIGCPTRMQHVGETGTGCPNGFLHVGKTEATHEPKIHIYDGKEDWTVWINRFEAIAGLRRWDEDRKLDCLLPKLHGKVGEYAFAALPKQILGCYEELVGELNSMFRKVEITSAIAAKFHNRIQGEDESVEEYAAELRCLSFKAYNHRSKQTREEDLVQRFLYGLRDEEMRFAVEFYKEPVSLDEAVYHAVEYAELRNRIFEGQLADKEISKQGREECFQYNEISNETIECCYPDGPHTTINAVAQKPADQIAKDEDRVRQQNHDEIFEVLLQIKDSLQTLAKHKGLDNSGDGHLKPHQDDTRVSYCCKSYDHNLGNCPDGKSDNIRRAEESHTDLNLLLQDVCNLETGRNAKSQQSSLVARAYYENRTWRLQAKPERRRSRETTRSWKSDS